VVDGAAAAGSVAWRPARDLGPGIYFVRLTGPGLARVRRVSRVR